MIARTALAVLILFFYDIKALQLLVMHGDGALDILLCTTDMPVLLMTWHNV